MNELESLLATLQGARPDEVELKNLLRLSIPAAEPSQPSMSPTRNFLPGDTMPADNLSNVQERVDYLMQNDPQFKKDMNLAPDPLAADKNGFNLPKTGVANTTGAMQRINARAEAEGTGVSATMDKNGQLTLSNLSPQTGALLGGVRKPGTLAQTGSSPIAMSGLLTQLRTAGTAAEGNVIMDSLRSSMAAEQAKLNTEALMFASNKLGVPGIEQQLIQSEANDRASYGWFPGIGDSPGTQKIRGTLQSLRTAAGAEAEKFLATSMSSGVLKTQMISAEQEMKRIAGREDRRANLTDQISLRRQDRTDAQAMEDESLIQSIAPMDMANLKILVPQIPNDDTAAMGMAIKATMKNKDRVEALKAASVGAPDDLIQLSVRGNADARLLLLNKEKLLDPSLDEDTFNVKMKRIQNFASSDDYVKKSVKARGLVGKDAEAEIARLNAQKLPGRTADEKAIDTKERFATAIQLERQAATGNFLSNAGKWRVQDPVFQAAVDVSLKQTGKADFDTVLTNYLGESTGAEALQKLTAITATVQEAFGSQKASVFGMPDVSAATKMIAQRGKQVGIGSLVSKGIKTWAEMVNFAGDNLTPAGPIKGFYRGASQLIDSFNVKVDPTTGLPYQ